MLKTVFINLVNKYADKPEIAEFFWAEIEKQYTGTKRYYHNLQHLENMYIHLETCREQISDWDTILYCFHYFIMT